MVFIGNRLKFKLLAICTQKIQSALSNPPTCRTYNILVEEDRRAVAEIII
jgi:uncharacterized protein